MFVTLALAVFGIFIPTLPTIWKDIMYGVSLYWHHLSVVQSGELRQEESSPARVQVPPGTLPL